MEESKASPPSAPADFVPPWSTASRTRRALWWLRSHLQWLFLIVLAVAGLFLWDHVKDVTEIPSYAMEKTHGVGSQFGGVVSEVLAHEGQPVRKGQVVARLDSTILDNDLLQAQTKVEELLATISSTRETFKLRQIATGARVDAFASEARLGVIATQAEVGRWRAEVAELDREIAWQENLRQSQLAARPVQIGTLKARREALRALIDSAPKRIGLFEEKTQTARELGKKYGRGKGPDRSLETVLQPVRLQLKAQELLVEQLKVRKERLELRAPVDGAVGDVRKRRGDPVAPADTVLTVVEDKPRQVVAYIRDTEARRIRVGTKVVATARAFSDNWHFGLFGEKRTYRGKVVGLSAITILPGRFRDYIRRPIWARPVTIELEGNPDLIPGERMHVTFEEHGS